MTKLLPTKHLLLIAVVSVLLAVVLIALPSDVENDNKPIRLEANFEIVDQSQLQILDLQNQQTNQQAPQLSTNSLTSNLSYDIAPPSVLAKKNREPTFMEQSVKLVPGDSLSKVLSNKNISAQDIYKVSLADKKQKTLLRMKPGQTLNFVTNDTSGELTKLTLIQNRLDSVIFTKNGDQFDREEISRKPDIVQTYKEATINSSLFVDGLHAGINQSLLIELANIFGWDIDFALDIRKGDSLSMLYEEKFLDGEKIGHGNIIAAQFINNGRTYKAIRYVTKRGAHYYTPDGLAMRKAFIRTPVDFTRISSKFNPKRLHPIFKTSRPHRGVDYAASSGTPVKAAGDGKISFAGKQNGYGNVVIIDHGKGYQTLYAHLRGFARGTKRGRRVSQGKIIAYVGQTGWATGPHLHYEFRINGTHKNPVTVKLPNDTPMAKKDLKEYLPYAQEVVATLENSHSPSFAQKLALLKN
ncbi:peptidoglycan DD-metalloendopeptidase family protein [Marinomonas transparens]|uniref:Peptidoglycan DD-metalloendopeptidase family protein n=1 Tax=Marinomonas transparens TaxID=2795388 RepID=A0A934JZI8_9GAMM|nr:peptidoglycan DD-metalloendopeptidase family protein [Marinomonas transparens]MBJ7539989.1 peptidoglycan DD-metalloendopeptidase family protein [Marinomonas transparens]